MYKKATKAKIVTLNPIFIKNKWREDKGKAESGRKLKNILYTVFPLTPSGFLLQSP